MAGPLVLISRFDGAKDNAPKTVELTFTELGALLADSKVCPCTLETCGTGEHYLEGAKPGTCRHKYGAAWSPAAYPPGAARGKNNVGTVGVLVLDLDHMSDADVSAVMSRLVGLGLRFIVHASHSDGLRGEHALRVVIELSEPVAAADWPRFWQTAIDELAPNADPAAKDSSRLYFLPSRRADATLVYDVNNGHALNVRETLAKAPAIVQVNAPTAEHGTLGPASPALIERARQRLKANGPAIEGQNGDNKTFSVCAALLHDYAMTDAEAWPLLLEWNETCVPPWALDDLQVKMANGRAHADGSYGAGRIEFDQSEALRDEFGIVETPTLVSASGKITDPTVYPELETLDAAAEAYNVLDGLGADPVVVPVGEPGTWSYEIARARADIITALGKATTGTRMGPMFESADALFEAGRLFAAAPWLIQGLIPEGGVHSIVAGPKSSKSWLALEAALAIASGSPALNGRFKVPAARKAAYYFAEDQAVSVRNRIRAFAAGRNVSPAVLAKNLHVQPRGEHLDLTRDEDMATIVASCRMIGELGILILDPLRDIHTGKENESDDMSVVFTRLRVLATLLKCTILVPHHAKKPSANQAATRAGDDIRGSSAVYGALDGIIALRDLESTTDDDKRRTTIATTVQGEFKAARAAAPFRLTLTITDDQHDQAIHATWAAQSLVESRAADTTDELGEMRTMDAAIELAEHIHILTARKEVSNVRKMVKALGCGNKTYYAALAYATAKVWVAQSARGNLTLTEAGKRFLKERAAEGDAPALTLDEVVTSE